MKCHYCKDKAVKIIQILEMERPVCKTHLSRAKLVAEENNQQLDIKDVDDD